jgi:hypothetical protein
LLSANTLLSNESLDLGGFPEGLVATLDGAAVDVFADIVFTLDQGVHLSDVGGSLGSSAIGAVSIGDTVDILLSLLDNSQEDNSQVSTIDATTD